VRLSFSNSQTTPAEDATTPTAKWGLELVHSKNACGGFSEALTEDVAAYDASTRAERRVHRDGM
jgi:hypothetical protein